VIRRSVRSICAPARSTTARQIGSSAPGLANGSYVPNREPDLRNERRMDMLRAVAAAAFFATCAGACSDSTDQASPSTVIATAPTEPPSTLCDGRAPTLQLVAEDVAIEMELISISRSCGYDGDGAAMLDPAYRPAETSVAVRRLDIVGVPDSAEVKVDIRPLTSATSVANIQPGGAPLNPGTDGRYSIEVPGDDCLLVTVAWATADESGRQAALIQTNDAAC
jgi:hypothetical protein